MNEVTGMILFFFFFYYIFNGVESFLDFELLIHHGRIVECFYVFDTSHVKLAF